MTQKMPPTTGSGNNKEGADFEKHANKRARFSLHINWITRRYVLIVNKIFTENSEFELK